MNEGRHIVVIGSGPAGNTGATIVGHHAGELIGILALAVQGGIRTGVLVSTLMVQPSLAESVVEAAD